LTTTSGEYDSHAALEFGLLITIAMRTE
jgi:hypothetical protein